MQTVYRIATNFGEWTVFSGYIEPATGKFVADDTVFVGSLCACYTWVKAKEEGLLLDSVSIG